MRKLEERERESFGFGFDTAAVSVVTAYHSVISYTRVPGYKLVGEHVKALLYLSKIRTRDETTFGRRIFITQPRTRSVRARTYLYARVGRNVQWPSSSAPYARRFFPTERKIDSA